MTSTHHGRPRALRPAEDGVSLIEMMIAILVLTIGLVALAQLFVAATMNNTYVVATAGGLNDAQRLVEHWKYVSATSLTSDGVSDTAITSSMYDPSTQQNAAFATLTNYVAANSAYKEYVWVFKSDGTTVGSTTNEPANPPTGLSAPTLNSRLVYIRMVPKSPDPRVNNTINLMAVVGGK
jgi:prepilin-type N-terminal cleavage/methylation domain-containing protein